MRALLAVVPVVVAVAPLPAQRPGLPPADRVRIAEAFRLAAQIEDRLWPHWSDAPFALLLVTDSLEFLVRHPNPSDDFQPLGRDSLLETAVFLRNRVYAPDLLATFPAVTGVPTIVIGEPANTGRSSTEWVLTVLHEHFHQLEYSHPGYYAGVDSLRLSRGDQTGMWMLNYPFPYDSAPVAKRFAALARVLARAVTGLDGNQRIPAATLTAYAEARAALEAALSADDYRYLSFQLWQEGVARYVEYRAAAIAAREYTPSPGFRALPDYADYGATAERLRRNLVRELMNADLAKDRRTDFYPVGAATALLLDAAAPQWKARYFTPMFTLDPLFVRRP
jgi:hypothetical protein